MSPAVTWVTLNDLVPCAQAPGHPPPSPMGALNQCFSQRHRPGTPEICTHPTQVLTLFFLWQEEQPLCLKDRMQASYPKDKRPFLEPVLLLSVVDAVSQEPKLS